MLNAKPLETMDFTVQPNELNKTFVIRREGKVHLIQPSNEALFEYLKFSTKMDWIKYLKRNHSNLNIKTWTY